ncbi:MAG: GAF domain-containing protein [Aggregatilineales bacterium]
MNPTIKIYLQFIETLADRAKHSPDIVFRNRLRGDILRYTSRIMNVTSVYLCQHNFEAKHSILRGAFVLNTFDPVEAESEIGTTYYEPENSDWSRWLRDGYHTPRVLHTENLSKDHPEYEEYGEFDMLSIIFVGVYYQGDLWGYVETWDTRNHREYPRWEQEVLEKVCQLISTTILTDTG